MIARDEFIKQIKEKYPKDIEVKPSTKYQNTPGRDYHINIFFYPGEQFHNLQILIDIIHEYGIQVISYETVDLSCDEAEVVLLNEYLSTLPEIEPLNI